MLFTICLNCGFFFIGNALEIPGIANHSLDFDQLKNDVENQTETAVDDNSWDPTLIFGNFLAGAQVVLNIISNGYVIDTMTNIGFSEDFTFPMQAIWGVVSCLSVVYMISGRQ